MVKPRLMIVLGALVLSLPLASFAKGGMPLSSEFDPEISRLHHEIAAAKLDKLLELSRDQARDLLPLLKEAQQIREQLRTQRKGHRKEIIAALTRVRDDIRASGEVSSGAKEALKEAHGDRPFLQAHQKMDGLRQKIRKVLTADQKENLRKFDPRPRGKRVVENADQDFACPGPKFSGKHGRHGHKGRGMHFKAGPRHRAAMMIALTPEFQTLLEERAR